MSIHYIEPLSRAISRTKQALFNPMDLKKWFVVGFAAFLAALADVGLSGGGVPNPSIRRVSNFNLEQVLYFPQRAWEWLGNHPGWAMLIAFTVLFFVVFMVVITWLSARGKFIFLDNVVRGQARIVAPWYEYRKEGNSFFRWNLFWGVISSAISVFYIIYCFLYLQAVYESRGTGSALILPAVLAGLGLFAISIFSAFIYVLLRDFVSQIMYRNRITGCKAIQRFLPLFFSQFFHFLGYEIFLFIVSLLVVVGIFICGCITCCIGFVILSIPYINAVVLLPLSYAMRAFSVEFLEQFGPEYQVFTKPDANPPATVPPVM